MKIIYKAEDGTEFESEDNCREYEIYCAENARQQKIIEQQDKAWHDLHEVTKDAFKDSLDNCGFLVSVLPSEITDFVVENIQKINEILGYKVDEVKDESEFVFVASDGIPYKTAPQTRSCDGCAFFPYDRTKDCQDSDKVFCCGKADIIWIKK